MVPARVRVVWWLLVPAAAFAAGAVVLNWRSLVEAYHVFRLEQDPELLLTYTAGTAGPAEEAAVRRFISSAAGTRCLIARIVAALEGGSRGNAQRIAGHGMIASAANDALVLVAAAAGGAGAGGEATTIRVTNSSSAWQRLLQVLPWAHRRSLGVDGHPDILFEVRATWEALNDLLAGTARDPGHDAKLLRGFGPHAIAFRPANRTGLSP